MTPFATVDIRSIAPWILSIPLEEWPQQHRLRDEKIRPAMVTDREWHGFNEIIGNLEMEIMAHFGRYFTGWRALSAVMPGHAIPTHTDAQRDKWLTRVHVPLVSNSAALFIVENECYHFAPGMAYQVNTRVSHGAANGGPTPRIHFMLDVVGIE